MASAGLISDYKISSLATNQYKRFIFSTNIQFMRNKYFIAITFVVAIFLCSCTRNYVALDDTNARGEVPQLGNLVFRFNKALYPDSLLNNWDSTEYVRFSPVIPGRFRWNGPDELVFSPAQPLNPATTYKAEISKEVLRFSEYNSVKEGDDIQFSTAPLQLTDARVTWVLPDETSRNAVPQLQLQFNYPVEAAALQDRLKITVGETDVPFTLQHVGSGNTVSVRLQQFKAEDRNYEAAIVIGKGLKPVNGHNSTTESIKTNLSIPSPFVLNITNVESEHDGTQGIVHVYTSQQLATDQVTRHLFFDPAVKYSVNAEEYGFTLRSEQFSAENSYSFTINMGMRGKIGGVLKEPYNGSIAFGQMESDIRFTNSKAVYLSRKGGGNIEVQITNTPKVKLVISRIYENNLLMAQKHGYYPQDERGDEEEYYDNDGYGDAVAGDVVYSKEIDSRSLPKTAGGRVLNISQFEDRLPDLKGIYHVMIRSTEDYWIRDSRFVSFSDLGMMARQGDNRMFVFTNSIKTANPVSGVTVNVYGANNQLLGTAASNEDGAAEVQLISRDLAGFRPAMIIAKTADDFTYLPLNTTKVNTSRFDVGGKRTNNTGLDAFVYAERDIYRPGETIHYAVVLRDALWKSPGALPVKLKMLLPNGKEFRAFRKSLNEQGGVDGSIEIPGSALTGSYAFEVYSSNDVLLATKNFMVEEFVPDRIRVSATLDKQFLTPAESAVLSVNAVNFFGPAAANRNYEVEMQVRQKPFSSKKFTGYDFSLANQRSFYDKEVREGKTDAGGNAKESFSIPEMYRNSGLLQAAFYATVFDETGRPVSRNTTVDIYTQDVFHGIRDDGYYYYALNQPVKFSVVSVNRSGDPVTAKARVQIIKQEYRTVLARSGSYFRYESQQEQRILSDNEMQIGANSVINYIPRSPGTFEVRIYRPGANAYVSKRFYSYGSWGSNNSSFEVNNEGHVDIALDKEAYTSGETAKLLFKTPFSGRMLVTVERDKVLSYQYLDVAGRTASLDIKLSAAHVPNIYVTATLIKPHEISDIPLTVAHGFQNIKVEEKDRRINVQITAQEKVRSRTKQKVTVKALPGSFVTLAAVDNGVLQVSDFKTPDPYGHYYQKRALEVFSYDMYPLLFPELRGKWSSTGGDGEMDMSKRVNPVQAKRVKILSYWSGMKKANGNGVAEFEYEIPQFSGEVRLMAVAFKDENFGAAEKNTVVADPIVLSSALPRFMSPGDTVLVPVTISNTTSRQASAKMNVQVAGPVTLLGGSGQSVSIAPNSEGRAVFRILANNQVAVANITVQVDALGEKFTEATEIAVRPPSTLQKLSGSGSITGNSRQQVSIPQQRFLKGSFNYELVVSRSPVTELGEHLRYLIQYPYGCTEQTISAAFPQLYYGDFADLLKLQGKDNANTNVMEAIRKIRLRQLYNGALTLWDGAGEAHWWTTVYGAHFLLEARKAGFDVDNSLLETMLSYLTNRLKTKETINYYYNRNQNKKIAPKEVAYSLYVLSLAGRPQVAVMNYYKANNTVLALDSKYLLSAAYAVSGDKRSFSAMLPQSFSGEVSEQETGGSFYSALRDESIALNALLDVDPGHPQIPVMAKHVAQTIRSERYPNTQERAFAFLALGKIARSSAASNVTADIIVNGKTIAKADGNWKASYAQLQSANVEIQAKGAGRLYYTWVAEGISATGDYTEEDQYIKIRRRFFDRFGNALNGNTFKQNDLVVVELTLDKTFNNGIDNIVITDLLPAGFEIENPRTKEIPGMDWIKNASEPLSLDVRDDRIHFFVNAYSPRQKYYYAVRAVALGQFRQGPVSADAMYNGEIHSYHGAQVIRVQE